MKYDDASWHYGGDFPEDLPREAGATHTGMFVAWALLFTNPARPLRGRAALATSSAIRHSQDVRGELGQGAALALGQGDVSGEALVAELVHHVDEAVVGRVHVGIVDLVRIAGQHDLRVVSHPRDDRLHLVRREVLRLVDDDVLVGDAAAADVGERLDGDEPEVDQLLVAT